MDKLRWLFQLRSCERDHHHPPRRTPPALSRIGGACRLLWNVALEQRRIFSRRSRHIGSHGQAAQLAELKEAYPFFAEVPHHCLQQTLCNLDAAFQRFFKGRAGCPKPKRKRDRADTFRFPDPAQFRMRMHRPLPAGAKVKSITISQEANWWFAALNYEAEIVAPTPHEGLAVGCDMGVAVPLMLSTGEAFDVPRRKKGSRNKEKARRALTCHVQKHRVRARGACDHVEFGTILARGLALLQAEAGENQPAPSKKQRRSKKTTAGGRPVAACGELGATRSTKQEERPARAAGPELNP